MTRILVILAIIGIVAWRRRPVSSQTDELPFRDPYLDVQAAVVARARRDPSYRTMLMEDADLAAQQEQECEDRARHHDWADGDFRRCGCPPVAAVPACGVTWAQFGWKATCRLDPDHQSPHDFETNEMVQA